MLSCSILSLSEPTDYSPPGSSVYGINLARILVWVTISSSRESSNPGIKPLSPVLSGWFFTTEPPGKPLNVVQTGEMAFFVTVIEAGLGLAYWQADRKKEKEKGSWVSPVPEAPNRASHGVGGDHVKLLAGWRQSGVPKGCCEVGVYNAAPSFMEIQWLVSYHFIISCVHISVCVCMCGKSWYLWSFLRYSTPLCLTF